MDERMTQVLENLRAAVGPDKWDAFFEAMYDAFGNHDELDGENAVLFEQVQVLKRENNELKMKFVAANRKSIDLEHEVADLKAEYEGCIKPLHYRPDTWERIINESYMRGVKAQQEAQMEARERGAEAFVSSVEIPDDYDLVIRCKELCERTMSGDGE